MRNLVRPDGGTLGVVVLSIFLSLKVSATELRFRGPLGITNISRPVTVHAGDVDGNGKLDLIASNGTGIVTVFFQDKDNRAVWDGVPVRVGASCFFTRAGDFDNDGFDDLAVADGGSVTYFVRSRGDRTFDAPRPLDEARGSRWIATGDWNKDGNLDLASSNLATSTLTIFVGDGTGNFLQTGRVSSGREHTLEALDYDGDGVLDLALGTGLPGIQLHQGQGDGTFKRRSLVRGHGGLLGCVEYIAIGDFNNDGLDDLAPTCIDDQTAYVGVSLGNGRYERILKDPFAAGTEASAVGDFNRDGNDDLFLVSFGSSLLRVYPGKGDGTFEPIKEFGATGTKPVFLIAEDLDRDGHDDVISADQGSNRLTIFFGKDGEVFESSMNVTGYGTARDFAFGDLDNDGLPDFFYSNAVQRKVNVYLKPGVAPANRPTLDVPVPQTFEVLEIVDLNDDGIPDILGGDFGTESIYTILLDVDGTPRGNQVLPCDGKPRSIRPALIDGGSTIDLVVLCTGAAGILVFLGNGDGTFETARTVPTIDDATRAAVGDIDGDERNDVVVLSSTEIAVHSGLDEGLDEGLGGAALAPAAFVVQDASLSLAKPRLELADVDGDGAVDIVAAGRRKEVVLYKNAGAGEFGEPVHIALDATLSDITIVDANEDGMQDIVVGFSTTATVHFIFNLGPDGFSDPEFHSGGAASTKVRVLDLNGDRVKDIAAFSRTETGILIGVSDGPPLVPRFLRGDADNDGKVALNDAVAILNHLFRGAGPLACPDAGDSDDNSTVSLTDAVEVLSYLFRGGRSPAGPGGEECGEDPSEDELGDCSERC